ncbi:5936_t:CDS:2 [Entrophospora sp. SA101]|nr:5936_t:CDS:2 [Entrophospora sp. SA101]
MNSYRKKLIESLIINYWNRKTISKNIGFYNCLQQIGTKINLTSDDKQEVHRLYYSILSTLSEESSISQPVRKKMEAEKKDFMKTIKSLEVTKFWESKQGESYRITLDGHTRKEKMYLSSLHLTQLQEEDANEVAEEKDETTDEYACIENEALDVENNEGDDDSTTHNQALVPNEDIQYVERDEPDAIYRTRRWILSSGTDVGQILSEYRQKIPESQKCIDPIYWGILDLTGSHPETKRLFSPKDWAEMIKSFEDEIEFNKEDIPDVLYLFFDEVELIIKSNERSEDIITEIENISPQKMETKHNIILNPKDKIMLMKFKRATLVYAENLAYVDLPVSEGEICSWASSQRRNEGRSIILRARVGQKCDFRGTLKNSVTKLEALLGLRSGGLPEAHRKKKFLDALDLSITMRDTLYAFFNYNSNAPDEELHKMFVFGWEYQIVAMDCKGTNICRYGKLSTTILPNSTKTLGILEKFFVEMENINVNLNSICKKSNKIALLHARAHRIKRKRNDQEKDQVENTHVEVGGCFGEITNTPIKRRVQEFMFD